MADLPPISKTVDPKLSITSADQALALEKAFDDTFGSLDAKPEPRSEPGETPEKDSDFKENAPAEATPAEKDQKEDDKGADETPATTDRTPAVGHPDDEPDEEVDKFKIHPESKPESISLFRELRGMLKAERKKGRELIARQEANAGPRPVNDPGVQREIEELRQFRQKHQIFDDAGYQMAYENPVRDQFDQIINDIKAISNDPAAAAEWEKQMRTAGPDRLNRQYWNDGVISQIGDPLDRDRLVRKVSALIDLQERRNQFRDQVASEPDAYAKFQAQQAATYWDNFGKEAEDEIRKITPDLGEWATTKDIKAAKNATEKAAFEVHNNAYTQYEELFKKYISDAATQGPRGMARISAMAVHGEKHRRDLEAANKKIEKLTAERNQAREELNKISGARSRVAQSSSATSNGAPAPQTKRKASQDVDSAFRDFFGNT